VQATLDFVTQAVGNIFARYPFKAPEGKVESYAKEIHDGGFEVQHIVAMSNGAEATEFETRAPSSIQLKGMANRARSKERAAAKEPHMVSEFEDQKLRHESPGAQLAREFEEQSRQFIIDPGSKPEESDLCQARARAIQDLISRVAMKRVIPEPNREKEMARARARMEHQDRSNPLLFEQE